MNLKQYNNKDALLSIFYDAKDPYKSDNIPILSPVLVNILKALYTGTLAAIKGSKCFFNIFLVANKVELNLP